MFGMQAFIIHIPYIRNGTANNVFHIMHVHLMLSVPSTIKKVYFYPKWHIIFMYKILFMVIHAYMLSQIKKGKWKNKRTEI